MGQYTVQVNRMYLTPRNIREAYREFTGPLLRARHRTWRLLVEGSDRELHSQYDDRGLGTLSESVDLFEKKGLVGLMKVLGITVAYPFQVLGQAAQQGLDTLGGRLYLPANLRNKKSVDSVTIEGKDWIGNKWNERLTIKKKKNVYVVRATSRRDDIGELVARALRPLLRKNAA